MPPTPPTSNTSTPESQRTKRGIKEPRVTDVLCGRGGSINSHPRNETFRQLVDQQKLKYITSKTKRDKRSIAQSIVTAIGDLRPPGRFLRKDGQFWYLVDMDKARDKTSQALRENAPKMRKEIEEEQQLQKEHEEQQQTDEDEEGDGSQVKYEDEDEKMHNNMAQYHNHSRHHPFYHHSDHNRQEDHYYPTRDHPREYHGEYFQQQHHYHHQRRPTQYDRCQNDRDDRRHHHNYGPPQRRRDDMYEKSDMYYTEEKEDGYHSARRPHHPYHHHEEEKMDRHHPTYHPHHHKRPYHPQKQQSHEDEEQDVSMELEPIADWKNPNIDFRDPSSEKDKALVGSIYHALAFTRSSSLSAHPDNPGSRGEPSSTGHHPNVASATPLRSNTGSMDKIVHRLPPQSANHEDYDTPTRSSHDASSQPYGEYITSMDQSVSMGQVSSWAKSTSHRRYESMHTGSMMQVHDSTGSKPSNMARGGIEGQEVELLDALADSMDYDEEDINLIEGNKGENRIPPSPSSPISSLVVQHPPLVTSTSSTPSPLSPPSLHSTSNNICYSIFSDMLFSSNSNSLSSDDQIMDRQSSLGSLCGPSLCTAFEESEAMIPKSGGGADVQGQQIHHNRGDSEKTFSDNSMASLKDIMLQNSADLLHKLDSP